MWRFVKTNIEMILNLGIYAYVYCKFKILNQFKDTVAIPELSRKKPRIFEITISHRCYHVGYFSFQIL